MRVVETSEGVGSITDRPLPGPDHVSAGFWKAAGEGRLLVQRCPSCGRVQFYPRAMCTACGGDPEWMEASGDGTVYTFTVIRQNLAPPFKELGPYVVAMIQLAEGPLMMGNITGVDPGEVKIGMEVRAYAVRVDDDVAVPFWEPA